MALTQFLVSGGAAALLLVQSVAASAQDSYPVTEILQMVKKEIVSAQQEQTGQPRLSIDEVTLDLSIATMQSAEAGVKLSVPIVDLAELGASASAEGTETSRLVVNFKPETDVFVSSPSDLGLAAAIKAVKRGIQETINEPPPLRIDSFEYEARFVAVTSAEGGLKFWIVDLASAEWSRKRANVIKIKMSLAEDG